MGAVYRAEDMRLGRAVALKFVLGSIGADLNGRERLMREAKACAALNHPNITTVYDFGEDDGRNFIVMEFVEGATLEDHIKERKFTPREVAAIGIQIADALEAAHAKGIIHRDLKSANIMIDVNGRVKVMDFGLAKLSESSFITQDGATLGTAAYMSPEQVRSEELTPRSDLYSLGVVLYEMSTGVTPFPHAHHLAVMYAVANETPIPARERNPDVPEALSDVISRAMAKAPEDRFASCRDLSEALLAAVPEAATQVPGGITGIRTQNGHAAVSSGPVSRHPVGDRMALPALMRRRWVKIGAPMIAVAAAAAIALVTYGSRVPGGESPPAESYYALAVSHWNEAQELEVTNQANRAVQRYRDAQEALQRSIAEEGETSSAWSLLAGISARLGDFEQAIVQNERAVALDASNTEAHYNLGYALEEIGESERALAAYSAAIRYDSSFTEAYSALGNLLISLDRPAEALDVLNRAIEKTPDSPMLFLIHKNLGKAHLTAGRADEALPYLRQSLDANPDWPETTALLAQAYRQVGQREEARAMWRRYLEIEPDPGKREMARRHLDE